MDGIALFSLVQPSPGVCGLYGRVNCELQEGLHQGGSAGLPPGLLLPGPPSLWWTPASHTSTRDPPTGSFDSVSCGGSAPFLWVLVCTRFCLCPPRLESLFPPVLWNSYNQIPLTCKGRFPRDSQCLCRIPSLGSQMWSSEPSQQWENFLGIIVLQFVGHPPGRCRIWFYHHCAPSTTSL